LSKSPSKGGCWSDFRNDTVDVYFDIEEVGVATTQLSANKTDTTNARGGISAIRVAFAGILAAAIASYFWIDSRYPALLKKLHAGKGIHVSGGLSFDALIPVQSSMPFWTRVLYTAIDWGWTNRIGMTFGLCFGAAMLTLLAYLPRRGFTNAYSNTALGALIGTPLGVCANCVAPVGQGMLRGGASPATMLATMISSPTLNVVVLVMAFTLLPFPLAMIRLAAPLLLLAIVPLLVGKAAAGDGLAVCSIEIGPSRTALSVAKAYVMNLARLAWTTLPWMVLAGLLGALMIELVPAQALPHQVSAVGIVLVALLGTFAPVPIAFDVAIAWILLSRGVPAPYVATLVCTLGAFSIYPFFLVGRSLSWKVGGSVFGAVMAVGILAGVTALFLSI
jgi:uncharacterized membrane protein YraQ (UPF0718 family)